MHPRETTPEDGQAKELHLTTVSAQCDGSVVARLQGNAAESQDVVVPMVLHGHPTEGGKYKAPRPSAASARRRGGVGGDA